MEVVHKDDGWVKSRDVSPDSAKKRILRTVIAERASCERFSHADEPRMPHAGPLLDRRNRRLVL
jgi:hypothetical protein